MAAAFGYLSGVGGAGWIELVGVSVCLETAGLRRPPWQGQPSLLAAKTGGPEAQRAGSACTWWAAFALAGSWCWTLSIQGRGVKYQRARARFLVPTAVTSLGR